MNDTSGKMAAKMREMILRKLSEERLRMGCSMYDFSKQLVVNAILREQPDLSPSALRGELFRRFYGSDFDSRQQKKILEHLTSGTPSGGTACLPAGRGSRVKPGTFERGT